MTVDFPAAHSMDTCWFAIDRDGHVAYFGTGEAGAVPEEAFIEEPYNVLQELGRILPPTEVLYNFAGHVPPGPLGTRGEHWSVAIGGSGALFFLTSLDTVRKEISRGVAVQVPATAGGVAVVITDLTPQLVKRIHAAGACLGCFFYYEPGQENDLPRPAEHGLFRYSHLCENWVSGPYGLQETPGRPIHVDQLPPRLRELVGQFRFPSLCFGQTPHIQPVEHALCTSWESAYLTGDGLIIRENRDAVASGSAGDTYGEFYESMDRGERPWLAGIRIEPPGPEGAGE